MADLIKKIKIKKQDGTFTDYIPIGAEAQNISTNDGDSVQLKLNKKPYYYNNVSDMKADTKLKAGDMAVTLGYYEVNDGGAGEYILVNDNTLVDNSGSIHTLDNGLKAKLIISNSINVAQFGAIGNGTTDDSTAIYNAFMYILNNYNNAPVEGGYKQYLTLNFLPKKYLLSDKIIFDGYIDNCTVNGNGCFILGNGFKFGTKFGLCAKFDNFNFYDVDTCFEFDYINRNYQRLLFTNSIYQNCDNVFKINRRSCNVKFENCTFRNSGKAMYLNNIDKVEISNCWFQQKNETVDDYSSFIEQTGNDEGWIDVHDSMFIPQWTGNNISWFKINQKLTCHHNRFSNETPNYSYVVYTSSDMDTPNVNNQRYVVDIHDNPIMESNGIVILNGLPELLNISNNGGRKNGGKIIEWDSALTELEQKTKLVDKISSFHLVISGNGFRNFDLLPGDISQPSSLLPAIPENLYTFVQRKYRGQQHQIQYMIESHTKSGSTTTELKIKLFDLSSYIKRNNTGLTFMIVYRGNTNGSYNAENMINIVTLNQETNSSTLKISESTLMGTRTGDYTITFEGGSTSVDTSVTSNPILVLSEVQGRTVNYLQIMPFQTEDILSFGQL